MEIVFERTILKDGFAGYRMWSEDFEKLKRIVERVRVKHGDGCYDISKHEINISEKEKDDKKYFLIYNEIKDVTKEELDEIIELLKDAKREIEEKEIIKVCI